MAEMTFVEKINLIMKGLEADNISIAKYGGFDRTSLSRFRNGRRTPSTSSRTADMLVNGIYLYADNKNSLKTLCHITGGNPKGTAEDIKESVRAWLFDGLNGKYSSKKSERKAHFRHSFGERLDAVMNLTDVSNVRLSKLMNVDSSLISRYRAGIRSPGSNGMMEKLSGILWQILNKPEKLEELSGLMHIKADEIDQEAFHAWISDLDIIQQEESDGIDRLITAFDSCSSEPVTLPLVTEESMVIPENEKPLYIGTEGLRDAVLRFLGNAVNCGAKELWLYSDENMDWMTADPGFRMKWVTLMSACVGNRIKIRIIHNIDRGLDEMSDAIISWLPLYMTGMIEAYYCKRNGGRRFSHSMYICPGHASIEAFHVKGTENGGIYHYYTEKELVDISGLAFSKLLSESLPLASVTEPMTGILPDSGVISIRNTLSMATMPKELVDSLGSERVRKVWRGRRRLLTSCLRESYVYECVPIAYSGTAVFESAVVQLPDYEGALNYTPEQYAAHLRNIIGMLNRFPNYRFYILPDIPFQNMNIVTGTDFVKVTSTVKPQFSIMFTHPLLCAAFKDYVDNVRNCHKTDRNSLRKQLESIAGQMLPEAE